MRRTTSLAALAAAAAAISIAGSAAAQLPGPSTTGQETQIARAPTAPAARDADDSEFLVDAIRTDLAEIRLAELAQMRATDPKVREYAAKLRSDHASSMEDTAALVKAHGLEVPTAPSAQAAAVYDRLAKISGAEFDAEFLDHMIDAHDKAIEAYGAQTHANPDKALSDLAAKTLVTLREHLATAELLKKQLSSPATHASSPALPPSQSATPPSHPDTAERSGSDPQLRPEPERRPIGQ
jgi:putative membrane protein